MTDELTIVILIVAVLCLSAIVYLLFQTRKLTRKVASLTLLVKESDRQRETFKVELQELRSGSIGVGRKVTSLEKKLNQQSEILEEASHQDPQAKLYSRALKMVNLGAGIEELMQECELPKAEAELILRLHKK